MPTLGRVFWSGFWWSIAGGAVGAMLGLIVGLLGWGLPGTPDNIAVQIASWAMFLHVAGALAGCYAALDTGDRFARKADHHDAAATLVRVRSNDDEASMRAAKVLAEAGGVDVEGSGQRGLAGNSRAVVRPVENMCCSGCCAPTTGFVGRLATDDRLRVRFTQRWMRPE